MYLFHVDKKKYSDKTNKIDSLTPKKIMTYDILHKHNKFKKGSV